MKLIDEIIELLSSQSGSLSDALLKTKVLLHKIGHQELVEWVNDELNGYSDDKELPSYRRLLAQVLVNASNGAYSVTRQPIPLFHLTETEKERLQYVKMSQSLAVLENLVSDKGGHLQSPIPMEANHKLSKGLGNGYMVEKAWSEIQQADLYQIFIQVRSRLLDFILNLKDQIGDLSSEQDIKKLTDSIDTSSLFNNAIFGNNATIIVGSGNKQKVINTVVKGDFNTLANELTQHEVAESDISKLKVAIDSDEQTKEIAGREFGPSVKKWLKSMLSKAVDTSWQIELNIAGGLLVEALKKYYGWLS